MNGFQLNVQNLSYSPNKRWECAQKQNNKKITNLTVGMIATIPSVISVLAGSSFALLRNNEVTPGVLAGALIVNITIAPCLACLFMYTALYRNELKKYTIWSIQDIHHFKNQLQKTDLDEINEMSIYPKADNIGKIHKLAFEAGVISQNNYENWCQLVQNKLELDLSQSKVFNLNNSLTELNQQINKSSEEYHSKKNKLNNDWEILKNAIIEDLPNEAGEDSIGD